MHAISWFLDSFEANVRRYYDLWTNTRELGH